MMENGQWKMENISTAIKRRLIFVFRLPAFPRLGGLLCLTVLLAACSQLEQPKPEPLYAETAPPSVKEFRWSNGKLPKSFDPAKAGAPPETDVARAVYEGLTDTDAKTLQTVPAIALGWTAADDNRVWTFKLRRDAEWSNGERLTARDFVRSWKRLAALGEAIPHFQLLGNIVGMRAEKSIGENAEIPAEIDFLETKDFKPNFPPVFNSASKDTNKRQPFGNNPPAETESPTAENNSVSETKPPVKTEQAVPTVQKKQRFGVEALDDFTLKISLLKADKDFPALAAHPLFRPVYGDGKYFETGKLNPNIVTSGAFRIADVASDSLTLVKSENFYDRNQVEIERVRFVPVESAEKALEAYRGGEIDAVTNVDFEPLALKLLTPFDDFRRAAHGALNFYEFNRGKAPFDDRRVREALAISVERERLTEDEMDSASFPAFGFSPFENEKAAKLKQDVKRAQNLLAEAGFPGGANFPEIRLVVNRNDLQQRVARAVAKMWKKNLNVGTNVVVVEQAAFEIARKTKDYDVLRRGVVLPTTDETVNMLAVFSPFGQSDVVETDEKTPDEPGAPLATTVVETVTPLDSAPPKEASAENAATANDFADNPAAAKPLSARENVEILTEKDALLQISAIPLYFPTSYSLVKSYIRGFEVNTLDAPSLKNVRIDNDWQPKKARGES